MERKISSLVEKPLNWLDVKFTSLVTGLPQDVVEEALKRSHEYFEARRQRTITEMRSPREKLSDEEPPSA